MLNLTGVTAIKVSNFTRIQRGFYGTSTSPVPARHQLVASPSPARRRPHIEVLHAFTRILPCCKDIFLVELSSSSDPHRRRSGPGFRRGHAYRLPSTPSDLFPGQNGFEISYNWHGSLMSRIVEQPEGHGRPQMRLQVSPDGAFSYG